MGKKKKAADRLVVQNAAKTLFANIRFASVDQSYSFARSNVFCAE